MWSERGPGPTPRTAEGFVFENTKCVSGETEVDPFIFDVCVLAVWIRDPDHPKALSGQ